MAMDPAVNRQYVPMMTRNTAPKKNSMASMGFWVAMAMKYPPPRVSTPRITSSHFVFGSRSPAEALWSRSTGLARLTLQRFRARVNRNSAPKSAAVSQMPRVEISMPNWAGTRASFKRSRMTALENRMPRRRPPARVTAAQNTVSQKHIRAMCRFSSPKML